MMNKRYWLPVFLLLLLAGGLRAQGIRFLPDVQNQPPVSSATIAASGLPYPMNYTDGNKWDELQTEFSKKGTVSGLPFSILSVHDILRVSVNHDVMLAVAAYDYDISVQLACYKYTSPAIPEMRTVTLHLSYDPDSLKPYHDLDVYKFQGYHRIRATITNITNRKTGAAVPMASLARNFQVETQVITQRYDNSTDGYLPRIVPAATGTGASLDLSWSLYYSGSSSSYTICSGTSGSPLAAFKPAAYEVEWTYIDDYNYDIASNSKSYAFSATTPINYDFRNNSTRIRVNTPNCSIPLLYEHGAVIYRVRLLRPQKDNFNELVYSDWTLPDVGTSPAPNAACFSRCAYLVGSAHSGDNLNWQYTVSFAEDGKYKHVINYLDGTLKERQTQTKINTDADYVVAVDKAYDYEGRPALVSLPTPLLQGPLNYRSDVLLNQNTGKPYKAAELDPLSCGPVPVLPPVSAGAAACKYYSTANPDKAGMQQFVPDAKGYPLVQTVYAPDNTNKIEWQGGAGDALQPSGKHVTHYEYLRATQSEVDRLLGTEAGYQQYYPKQVTTDPNGQSSFTIRDAAGKVVISGLQGSRPDPATIPIDALPDAGATETDQTDLLLGVTPDLLPDGKRSSNAVYQDAVGTNQLNYSLTFAPYFTGCANQYLWARAHYELRVTNECGAPIAALCDSGTVGSVKISTSGGTTVQNVGPRTAPGLAPGKYLVSSELRFNPKEIRDQVSTFVQANQPACFTDAAAFVKQSVEAAAYECPKPATPEEEAGNACSQLKANMLRELYPGAKYGRYTGAGSGPFAGDTANSIFTLMYPALKPGTTYYFQNGEADPCTVTCTINPRSCGSLSGCGCSVGAHKYPDYCCKECISKRCICIQFPYVDSFRYVYLGRVDKLPCGISERVTDGFSYGYLSAHAVIDGNWTFTDAAGATIAHTYKVTLPVLYRCDCNFADTLHETRIYKYPPASAYNPLEGQELLQVKLDQPAPYHRGSHICDHYVDMGPTILPGSTPIRVPAPVTPYYRYQSDCISYPATVSSGGVSYSNIKDLSPDQFINIFNDDIAAALLPLHPDYCSLQDCKTDNDLFAYKLRQLSTFKEAEDQGLFRIEDIISKDPLRSTAVAGRLAYLYPGTADDAHSIARTAARLAYCNAGNDAELAQCAINTYSDWIGKAVAAGYSFETDQAKQRYFEQLRDLYLANRSLLQAWQESKGGSSGCSSCDAQTILKLSGSRQKERLFTPDPPAGGTGGSTAGGDSPDQALIDKMPDWMKELFEKSKTGTTDISATIPSALSDSMALAKADLAEVQINSVMRSLANASLDPVRMSIARDSLSRKLGRGEALSPDMILAIVTIARNGGAPDDLAHAFVVDYSSNYTGAAGQAPASFSCGDAGNYTSVSSFLANSSIQDALRNLGSSRTYTKSAGSPYFEQLLSSGAGLKATRDGKTIMLGFTPAAGTAARVLITPKDDGIDLAAISAATTYTVSGVYCLNDDPDAALSGQVAKRSAAVDISYTLSGTNYKRRFYIWSDFCDLMRPVAVAAQLNDCVTGTDLRDALLSFKSDKAIYGYSDASNHPLFPLTLTNYLNYKLKKQYKYDDYLRLMKGTAITDQVTLSRLTTDYRIEFTADAAADAFIAAMSSMGTQQPAFLRYKTGANAIIFADLHSLETDTLLAYRNAMNNFTAPSGSVVARGANYTLPGNASLVFAVNACTGFNPAGLGANSSTAAPVSVWEGGAYNSNYKLYQFAQTATTATAQAALAANVRAYLYNGPVAACGNTYSFPGWELLRSDDYGTPLKSAYLAYLFSTPGSHAAVVAAIDASLLPSRLRGFSGSTFSYANPYCRGKYSDLYAYIPTPAAPLPAGYTLLNNVLGWTRTALSNKLFPGVATDIGGTPGKLRVFPKANGDYWYRYFDAANKLYNIYISPDKVLSGSLSDYTFSAWSAGPHPNTFTVKMVSATARPATLTCMGYADFQLNNAQVAIDVVLFEDQQQLAPLDTADCERQLLANAILNGNAEYQRYTDSVVSGMSADMLAKLIGDAKEKLVYATSRAQYQYSLYYYDLAGNLSRTVPPAGVQPASPSLATAISSGRDAGSNTALTGHSKLSQYRYNAHDQVIWQQTPDAGVTEFFYDAAGRLAYSQTERQRERGAYTYTLYDALGRPAESGEAVMGCVQDPRSVLFTCYTFTIEGKTIRTTHPLFILRSFDEDLYPPDAAAGMVHSYSRSEVVRTVYDAAPENIGAFPDSSFSRQENLRSRVATILYYPVAGAFVPASGITWPDQAQFSTYFSYDVSGNVKMVGYNYTPLLNLGKARHRVDYDYDLVSGKVNMISYNRGRADQFYQRYSYDADNRITEAETSNDGLSWNRDARYYYYKHGPLARMELGQDKLQSLEYAYTIQGWLKAINGDVLNPVKEMGHNGLGGDALYARDVVAHALNYFAGDYKPINGSTGNDQVCYLPQPARNMYNGNIAQQTTGIAGMGTMQRRYQYDQLQRLKLATNTKINDLTAAPDYSTPAQLYSSSYSYDKDGNIQTLSRYDGSAMPQQIDNFTYGYASAGNNRLDRVSDGAAPTGGTDLQPGQGSGNYGYDADGNLVADAQGKLKISWNRFGKVKDILNTGNGQYTTFDYDGRGNRIWKETTSATGTSEEQRQGEYYVYDAGGKLLSSYQTHSLYGKRSVIDMLHTTATVAGRTVGDRPLVNAGLQYLYTTNTSLATWIRTLAIVAHADWVDDYTARPAGYYLERSPELVNTLMYSGYEWLDGLRGLAPLGKEPIPYEPYEPHEGEWLPEPPEGPYGNLMRNVLLESQRGELEPLFQQTLDDRNQSRELLGAFARYLPAQQKQELWWSAGLQYWGNPADNADKLWQQLWQQPWLNMQLAGQLARSCEQIRGSNDASWLMDGLVLNPNLYRWQATGQQGNGLKATETLRQMVRDHGDPLALAQYFEEWPGTASLLNQALTPETRFDIVYQEDPVGTMTDAIDVFLPNEITNMVTGMPDLTTPAYASILVALDPGMADILSPGSFELASYVARTVDTMRLAEHHFYGSSRVGVQTYDPADPATPLNTWGIMSTARLGLTQRRPWYSYTFGQLIDSVKKDDAGKVLYDDLSTFTAGRTLGNRYYEMNDHLGNVLATVLDRKPALLQLV